jgi:hypothetical protein
VPGYGLTRKKGFHEEGEIEVRKLRFFLKRRLKLERASMPNFNPRQRESYCTTVSRIAE